MSKINDGGPAFPQDLQGRRGDDPQYQGMTVCDWFAGQVLRGLASDREYYFDNTNEEIATACYSMADAMIAARGARNGN